MDYSRFEAVIDTIPQPSPAERLWAACDKLWAKVTQDVLSVMHALNTMIHADTSLPSYSLELFPGWVQELDPEKIEGLIVANVTLSALSKNKENIGGVIWDAYRKKGYRLVRHNVRRSVLLKLIYTPS